MNNFDLVKTAFAENDLVTLKKILQQLYIEITSFSNPEIVDQILESKNETKLKSLVGSQAFVKASNFIPVYHLVEQYQDDLRERGGILNLEDLKKHVKEVETSKEMLDKIIIKRLLNSVNYVTLEWECKNLTEDAMNQMDLEALKIIDNLLHLDLSFTKEISDDLANEFISILKDSKKQDYQIWMDESDYHITQKYNEIIINFILEIKEQEEVEKFLNENRNENLLEYFHKDENLREMWIHEIVLKFKKKELNEILNNLFKKEYKILLQKVDDPFEIDYDNIYNKCATILIEKWEDKTFLEEKSNSIDIFACNITKGLNEILEKDSVSLFLQKFKKGEIQSTDIEEDIKDCFLQHQASEDQIQKSKLNVLEKWKSQQFKCYVELKNLMLKEWNERKEKKN
eukprot:gene5496-9313_t